MSAADLVAVVTVSSHAQRADRLHRRPRQGRRGARRRSATPKAPRPRRPTRARRPPTKRRPPRPTTRRRTTSDLDIFNNDIRLRALKTLADTLAPIEQKKSIIYFSAGMQRSGQDNQVELRAAINAAVRGQRVVLSRRHARAAGGRAGRRRAPGQRPRQRDVLRARRRAAVRQLAASQDTLTSLAADTGGRAFTDTNDFGEAFARVQSDMSAYYLLGYSSTNPTQDGRFRRIQVRVKRDGCKVEARNGYYADRDFTHTSRGDRETQLQDQLFSAVSATDLPVMVTAGWFRLAADKYYVPVALAVPGPRCRSRTTRTRSRSTCSAWCATSRDARSAAFARRCSCRPARARRWPASRCSIRSGVTLPPGRFSVKVVVRENATGLMGTFETADRRAGAEEGAAEGELGRAQHADCSRRRDGKTDNPLVRDGVQLVPNLTHVVGRDQKLYFYYEVYDPAEPRASAAAPRPAWRSIAAR